MSACLPRFGDDLRHDRAVANGKSDGMSPWLRISAWLPPGLALGWLALLATFVQGVGTLLTAWAATVSLVILVVLRYQRRPAAPSDSVPPTPAAPVSSIAPQTAPTPSDMEERAAGTARLASAAENATLPASRNPDSTSGLGS